MQPHAPHQLAFELCLTHLAGLPLVLVPVAPSIEPGIVGVVSSSRCHYER